MTKINIKQTMKQLLYGLSVMALIVVALPQFAAAGQMTPRKVTLSSSLSAAANVTYTFNFTVPTTGTSIKSAAFQFCDAATGTCNAPGSFTAGAAALSSQPTNLGAASGWTNSNTANSIRILNAGNSTNPTGAQTVAFNTVTNPTLANGTFFIRMTTYSDAGWATPIDTGTVAASTAGLITVTASVDEALTFTLGSATVPLGTITTSTTGSGSSTMSVATNASAGYSITYTGNTLTSSGNTITALPSQTASTQNIKQFGINLMSNSTPSIGANVSGAGSGTASAGYEIANQYKFVSGETVAAASIPTNTNTYTVSYIANVDGATAAGAYSTAITYVATANF